MKNVFTFLIIDPMFSFNLFLFVFICVSVLLALIPQDSEMVLIEDFCPTQVVYTVQCAVCTHELGPHPCWWRVCYQQGLPRLVSIYW